MKDTVQNQVGTISEILRVDDLEMDLDAHTVTRGKVEIQLTRKEFALLEYFMRNVGLLLTPLKLLENVWDTNADPFSNTVEVHVSLLRRKVDDGRRTKLIKTVHGCGYKMDGK